jgi:hypothetical protein
MLDSVFKLEGLQLRHISDVKIPSVMCQSGPCKVQPRRSGDDAADDQPPLRIVNPLHA